MATTFNTPTRAVGRASMLTTPRRLQNAIAVTWVAALLLALSVYMGVNQLRYGIQTVGKDAAPSIVVAQTIRASLADMDANIANELIGKPGQNVDAIKQAELRRQEVTANLIGAAQNITYGDAERVPILKLADGLGQYEQWIATARTLHDHGDNAMLAAYRHAAQVLRETLIPAADALDKANNDELEKVYAGQGRTTLIANILLLLCGGALTAVLIVTQLYLSGHFRRTVNPALLAATALTALFTLTCFVRFSGASHRLRVAKEDAFDSVHTLWQVRALANDANGDESRWLLDRPHAADYEKEFRDKINQVAQKPAGMDYATFSQAAASGQTPSGFSQGLLAKELGNVTFPGEKEATLGMLRWFGEYVVIDDKIRQLENQGKVDEALALCIGNDPGESNYTYDQFDKELEAARRINQDEFDRAVTEGLGKLNGLQLFGLLTALGVGALIVFGLSPRIREYAV